MRAKQDLVRCVAIVASAYAPSLGGVEELTHRLALEQQSSGGTPLVATMRWPTDLPANEVLDGVPVWRGRFVLPEPDVRSLFRFVVYGPPTLAALVRVLRRRRIDVVHVQCVSGNGLYAWMAARLLRVPLVVSLQGELTMDATGVYQRARFLPWVLRELLRRADAITACSRQTLAEAEAYGGAALGDRGSVVYNGVSIDEFDNAQPEVRERPYVFAIGRHVPQKGFDVLIEAFARSGASATHDLVIAGDGPDRAGLEALAVAENRADEVHFVGRTDRSRTAALFRGCDLFVLPSRHEPMGIVNLEAMASSKPVVATAVGGVPELVIDGVTGVLVPSGDSEAMATAIMSLLVDPDRAERIGSAGRERALQFDWSAISAQYEAVYQRCADRKARSKMSGLDVLRRRLLRRARRLYAYGFVRTALQRLGPGYWRTPAAIRTRVVWPVDLSRTAMWRGTPERFEPAPLPMGAADGHRIAARRHRIAAPFATVIDGAHLVDQYAIPVTREGGVLLTPFRGQIGTLSSDDHPLLDAFLRSRSVSAAEMLDDIVFSMVGRLAPNYFHWVTEFCAQLQYVERLCDQRGCRPSVLVAADGPAFQFDSLVALGWGDSVRHWEAPYHPVQIRQLVVASTPGAQVVPSPASLRWLRDRFVRSVPDGPDGPDAIDAVYLARRPGSWRTMLNAPELEDALRDIGVTVIDPGSMPFPDQVALFRRARVIVGQHGAGLTNALFAERARLIELVGDYGGAEYYAIAAALGHAYELIPCEDRGGDVVADIAVVVAAVRNATQRS